MMYNSIEVMGYTMLSVSKHLGFAHDKKELETLINRAKEQGFDYVEVLWIDLEGKAISSIGQTNMTDILNRIPNAFK